MSPTYAKAYVSVLLSISVFGDVVCVFGYVWISGSMIL